MATHGKFLMDFRVTTPSFVPIIALWVMHSQAAEPSTSHGAGGHMPGHSGQAGQPWLPPAAGGTTSPLETLVGPF